MTTYLESAIHADGVLNCGPDVNLISINHAR